MSFPGDRVAILIDGEWFKKNLHHQNKEFPNAHTVLHTIRNLQASAGITKLYRIFYYTANPLTEIIINPLSTDKRKNYRTTTQYKQNTQLITELEKSPNVAVRRGRLVHRGWSLKKSFISKLLDQVRGLEHDLRNAAYYSDITPQHHPKGCRYDDGY